MSIFNIVSKLFNIPLLSVATSFVAEDISKNASEISLSGEVTLMFKASTMFSKWLRMHVILAYEP